MADYTLSAVLGADISEFQAKMAAAMDRLEAIGQKAQNAGQNGSQGFDMFGGSGGELIGKLVGVAGAVEAVMKAVEIGTEAFKEYGEHFKSITDLGVAIQANGTKNYKEATKSIEDFAKAMEESTGINKEQTLALAAQAASMGVATERIPETVELQQGLTKALGGQEVPLKAIIAAQEGHYQMLSRSIPALKDVKNAQEAYSIITAKAKVGISELTAEQEGGLGPMNRLQNSWKEIELKIGEALAKAINPIIEKFQQWLPVIEDVAKILIDFSKIALEPLITALRMVVDAARAISDVFHGEFKKAFTDLKEIGKDGVKGFKDVVGDVKDIAVNTVNAWNDGIKAASESKPAQIAAPEIKNGGAKEAGGMAVDTESYKNLSTIIKDAYLAMDQFGKTRPEALTKELKEIESSMQKIEDKGDKATKKDMENFNELAAAHKKVSLAIQSNNEMLETMMGIAGLTSEVAMRPLEPLEELNKKFEEITDTAKAFGNTNLNTLTQQLSSVDEQIKKMVQDGSKLSDPTTFNKLIDMHKNLGKAIEDAKNKEEQFKASMQNLGAAASNVGQQIGQAFGDLATGKFNPFATLAKLIGDAGKKFGEKLIALGVTMNIALPGSGMKDIIGGGAIIAASAALAAIVGAKKMASGGIVSGSSIVNVGEYSGAAHNPEVIAPLDKLRGMIGGGQQNHTFEISGDKLVSILQRTNNNTNFSLGE